MGVTDKSKKNLQDQGIEPDRIIMIEYGIRYHTVMLFVFNKIYPVNIYYKVTVFPVLPEKPEITVLYLLKVFFRNSFLIYTTPLFNITQQFFCCQMQININIRFGSAKRVYYYKRSVGKDYTHHL